MPLQIMLNRFLLLDYSLVAMSKLFSNEVFIELRFKKKIHFTVHMSEKQGAMTNYLGIMAKWYPQFIEPRQITEKINTEGDQDSIFTTVANSKS
jgi:hypothetical protein